MSDLKPCPFCGSKPYLSPGETRYYVKHGSACRINDSYNDDVVHVCFAKDDVEGYTGWNDRPIEDALKAQIAKLQADNRSLVEQMNQVALRMEHESGTAQRSYK